MDQPANDIIANDFENYYQVQQGLVRTYSNKVKKTLIYLAIIVFVADMIALAILNAVTPLTIAIILVVPIIFIGLGFIAIKEPLMSIIIATLMMVAVWVYTFIETGSASLVSGIFFKIVVITMLVTGFQNAWEATKIKRELKH